jgi:Domain of unknown function DUF302
MFARLIQLCSAALFACAFTASLPAPTLAANDGIVRVKSAYPIGETIERLKKDIADKGIKFFNEIDQSKLAADAGIKLRPSVLLIFGNPPLGTQFITAKPMPGSTGRCGCSSSKTITVRSGPSIPISTGSHADTGSRTAKISSRWRRALLRLSLRA